VCTFEPDGAVVTREWTVTGRPILASLYYSASDRATAVDGAEQAWRQATAP
jgi:hypothetical protein